MSKRTDWTIKHNGVWTATHTTGVSLVARTREALMSTINEWDLAYCPGTQRSTLGAMPSVK